MADNANDDRLDQHLVARGLFSSRSKAREGIIQGLVQIDGAIARKPGRMVRPGARVELVGEPMPYVSRGGVKLAHALQFFEIDVDGRVALDLGASTGGFVEVLLERGARTVYAVDVGRDQLDDRLRDDARVVALEGFNARDLDEESVAERPEIITCDVSFISLKLVLPAALALAAPGAVLVALIKPQFEAGREAVGNGGIVRDAEIRAAVCDDIERWIAAHDGWRTGDLTPAPIPGGDGNQEFLIVARKGRSGMPVADPHHHRPITFLLGGLFRAIGTFFVCVRCVPLERGSNRACVYRDDNPTNERTL